MIDKQILAFIHIEKAAGQTFIRILENNYVCRHCRIAPLKKEHHGVFQSGDLKILLKFNPYIEAVAGHSVMPFSDLDKYATNIKYITILRDPVKRYLSHYQYWVQVMNRKISFKEFLSLEDIKNFQTKKFAGSSDLMKAKKTIEDKIFLAGIVEKFDDFLMVLKNKMAPRPFDISYQKKNVAKSNSIKEKLISSFHKYEDQIYENNQIDIALYDFVKNKNFQKEKDEWLYKTNVAEALAANNFLLKIQREFIGRIYRNLYIGPIVNLIRYNNGLKVGGSY